jgi:DNA-binding transcriptional ArsR family regulator
MNDHACADPASCPGCGEHLIICCPNGCKNAELGAVPSLHPIGSLRAPRTGEKRTVRNKRRIMKSRYGTREKVLAALVDMPPQSPKEIAARMGDDSAKAVSRVSMLLPKLLEDGVVHKVLREGAKQGRYALAAAA